MKLNNDFFTEWIITPLIVVLILLTIPWLLALVIKSGELAFKFFAVE